jgi:hypothetical protein
MDNYRCVRENTGTGDREPDPGDPLCGLFRIRVYLRTKRGKTGLPFNSIHFIALENKQGSG